MFKLNYNTFSKINADAYSNYEEVLNSSYYKMCFKIHNYFAPNQDKELMEKGLIYYLALEENRRDADENKHRNMIDYFVKNSPCID